MKAVIIPTGIMVGAMTILAIRSIPIRKAAPKTPDAGITNLLSPPIIMRVICGATNPTNPIVPVKHIIPAAASDATIITEILVRSTFTPRLFAVSSPAPITLRSHAFIKSSGLQHTSMIAREASLPHEPLPRLPIIQIAASFSASGSAK